MAKTIMHETSLDRQVERYLQAHPPAMSDIYGYTLRRDTTGITRLTLELVMDTRAFEELKEERASDG